jgi:hypothetical protein
MALTRHVMYVALDAFEGVDGVGGFRSMWRKGLLGPNGSQICDRSLLLIFHGVCEGCLAGLSVAETIERSDQVRSSHT